MTNIDHSALCDHFVDCKFKMSNNSSLLIINSEFRLPEEVGYGS